MHARLVPRGTGPVWKISNSKGKAKTGLHGLPIVNLRIKNLKMISQLKISLTETVKTEILKDHSDEFVKQCIKGLTRIL